MDLLKIRVRHDELIHLDSVDDQYKYRFILDSGWVICYR